MSPIIKKLFYYFLITSILFSFPLSSLANTEPDLHGVWYLESAYSPEHGSFDEDFFYASEYGITDMLVFLKRGTFEQHISYNDPLFDETSNSITEIIKAPKNGNINIENGKLLFTDDDNNLNFVYSKNNPEYWKEQGVNQNAIISDFEGKWNLVNIYMPDLDNNEEFIWQDDTCLDRMIRIYLKNLPYDSAISGMQNFYLSGSSGSNLSTDSGAVEFMASETEILDGKFSRFSESPWIKIVTNGKPNQDNKYNASFSQLYGNDYMLVVDFVYTESEWEKGPSYDNGSVSPVIRVYERSLFNNTKSE